MENIIDLHIHTTCSDGVKTPFEVIDIAVNNGVKVMSITDHDTTNAYTKEVIDYALQKGIKLIKGVEISTKINKCGIHVLGYNYDLNNQEFKDKLKLIRNARHDYLHNVSKLLIEHGYKVNVLELDKIDAVTKAHIALDIIENEENYDLLNQEFNHIPSKGEFIETIMNEGCPCYVKKVTVSPKEASIMIRKANGKVILAHPVAYKYEDNLTLDETLSIVKDMEADGIEANYVYVDRNDKKINEVDYWNKVAKENNLRATIGSDFHKDDGLRPVIGLINEDVTFTENQVKDIVEFLES